MGLLDPALTVGGQPLYPMAGQMMPGVPVYRPERGDLDALFGSGQAQDDARTSINNIAGGILNGYQVNPNAGQGQPMLQAIAPSGMFTGDPSQASQVQDNRRPERGLTYRDAFALQFNRNNPMPPALFEALGEKDSKGRFKDLFGFSFDADAAFDPSSEDYQKLSGMLAQPSYYDNTR